MGAEVKRWVVYEVWTRARIIEAGSEGQAWLVGAPEPTTEPGLHLSNWHVVDIPDCRRRVAQ